MYKIMIILVLLILLPNALSNDQKPKHELSFLEIYKAGQQSKQLKMNIIDEKACPRDDEKCQEERAQAMLFSDKSKPDASKEYQILCHRCCEGTARKEECADFGNWAKKEKCGCE